MAPSDLSNDDETWRAQMQSAFAAARRERGLVLGSPAYFCAETPSTNDEAKSAARDGAVHGSVFVARRQTRGRGRQGRQWIGSPDATLMFSVLLRPPSLPLADLPLLPLLTGLAVARALERLAVAAGPRYAQALRAALRIKWPNDVMLGGGKLCGVLAESMYRGSEPEAVVLGVGLNRLPPSAPADALPGYAPAALVEVFEETTPTMPEVLAEVLQALADVLRDRAPGGALADHALVEAFDALDLLRDVQVEASPHEGIARGITPAGHLRLQTATGEVLLHAGEVHLGRRSPR